MIIRLDDSMKSLNLLLVRLLPQGLLIIGRFDELLNLYPSVIQLNL